MATGSFWNTDNPTKPWGLLDPDSTLKLPINIGTWLADLGSGYASHTVLASTPLESPASARTGDIVSVTIKLATSASFVAGRKYPFTVRLTTVDGQVDDRTLWLKVKDR